MDRYEFAGLIANGRVFKADKGKYITFLTLGVGNGKYIDITVNKPIAYADADAVTGVGRMRMLNGTQYLECQIVKAVKLKTIAS